MKNISLLLFFIFILVVGGSAQEDELLMNTPKEVKAGNEFFITISIPKNYFEGVARIQFEIPNGMQARAKKTENADFKFENQKAVFQWLLFPRNQVIEISMSIDVAATVKGYMVLRPSAIMLKNGEPSRTEMEPQVIMVTAGDKSKEELVQSIEKTKFSYEVFKSEGVACIRQVPYERNGEIIVNILVSKGDMGKYGKIQEQIPVGYEVVNIKSQNAIFVFNPTQRIIKYMWMNMPDKPQFVVSYKLIPTNKVNKSEPFLIYGTFYYSDNNKTLTVDIQERGIDLETL
jgi:hypothetical protein